MKSKSIVIILIILAGIAVLFFMSSGKDTTMTNHAPKEQTTEIPANSSTSTEPATSAPSIPSTDPTTSAPATPSTEPATEELQNTMSKTENDMKAKRDTLGKEILDETKKKLKEAEYAVKENVEQ